MTRIKRLRDSVSVSAALLVSGVAATTPYLVGCASPHRTTEVTHTIKQFAGRQDGMIACEEWRDFHRAGAVFLFTDPTAQGFCDTFTNQPALGGSSWFRMGTFSIVLDTNTAAVIGAGGTALGNVVGAAVKAAVK